MIKIWDSNKHTHVEITGDAKDVLSELYYFKIHEDEIINEICNDVKKHMKECGNNEYKKCKQDIRYK